MFSITVLAMGKLKEKFYLAAAQEYAKRLSGYGKFQLIELPEHPFFLASQFHPEFLSRPNRPHPLFRGFVAAALVTPRP